MLLFIIYTALYFIVEKEMATHSSTLAWEIPWMEEPVIKNRLQVAGVQAHLPQHCVLLFCREEKGEDSCKGTALGNRRVKVTVIPSPGCPHPWQGEGVKLWHIVNNTVGFANIVHKITSKTGLRICLIGLLMEHDILPGLKWLLSSSKTQEDAEILKKT